MSTLSRQEAFQYGFFSTMTLYHQTDPRSANAIAKSGKFKPGSSGLAGGGIYFTTSPTYTYHKAHNKGVIIKCCVRLGEIKKLGKNGEKSLTAKTLKKQGYGSAYVPRMRGDEYVVYDTQQIKILGFAAFARYLCYRCHEPIPIGHEKVPYDMDIPMCAGYLCPWCMSGWASMLRLFEDELNYNETANQLSTVIINIPDLKWHHTLQSMMNKK